MSNLFSSINIGKINIKNRIVMPPMCMYEADEQGFVSDFHIIHYATRAIGQTGLIILEATPVEESGRISNNDIGIWSDKHIEGLAKISNKIKEYNCTAGIQLGHAGRKCGADIVEEIYAPSSIAFNDNYRLPIEMTKKHIDRVINSFKEGARRAEEAGFELIEIHAAHGYLLSEFLSPLCNKREDEYGGSNINRSRILGEVLSAVKEVFNGVIAIRVSADDYAVGGNKVEDIVNIINIVKDKGVDLVDVSSGGVVDTPINTYPGYQISYAETIKQNCNLPVIGGGLLSSPEHMEELICNNRVDMVFVGRELLRNPYFPLNAAHILKHDIEWNKAYKRGKFM